MAKDAEAFRTIGELSDELGVAQHILRYWETRFPQLQPLKRAGNRRYYRPDDVALVKRIDRLLNEDGFTIKGVQKVLAGKVEEPESSAARADAIPANIALKLKAIRNGLADALGE
ncbi:MerR family transcriptional regulator [Parasphingopyxis marina]|uniref:MerR family transcriptional regulator n=1 Tax=Parasphingopyxis marina TaxID=2761622 RepID=A0A842I2S3_9SPHN|nr:MerR family transcriptional regulator [Parasphingopyxis marina]MBC2779059.1 MerR family transcriptional regulator [Parasphingopyxis marina]